MDWKACGERGIALSKTMDVEADLQVLQTPSASHPHIYLNPSAKIPCTNKQRSRLPWYLGYNSPIYIMQRMISQRPRVPAKTLAPPPVSPLISRNLLR